MFFKMIRGTLLHQWKKMLMIALTIALGSSLATAMISVVMDVGDKVNQELKAYGANITVVPKQSSIVSNLYDVEDETPGSAYLKESELGNIKTIFWAFNIVDFAPFVTTSAALPDGTEVHVVGSWFNHHLDLPTGEQLDAGMSSLRSWWDIREGQWIDEQSDAGTDVVMVGAALADQEQIGVGDQISFSGSAGDAKLTVVGIYESGGDEDNQVYVPLHVAQNLADLSGSIGSIEVSALTTPDNELAKKAAKDPSSLTVAQYEVWYCTAYASSICYQIQEVITDSVASPVRQVADSEGAILDKTELLMLLIMFLSLVGSALGISNLVTASVMERSGEIGLMKAIGAYNRSVTALVLTEILIASIIGGVLGFFAGIGFAQIIGQSVFGSAISIRTVVIPIVGVLVTFVTLAGSIPAIRMLLGLQPAEVLHGR
ncbi:ABC transporter permease [uncultured Oscillibacter sp.]|uniref:ABC transporter permease n=1 Tax=uncultured Oscillibacter sp. TaxID=876091 RepID=UPI0025F56C07|nr:ABC transporter permease [uncultured Oscillibacter sp.]